MMKKRKESRTKSLSSHHTKYRELLGAVGAQIRVANRSGNADGLSGARTIVAGKEAQALNLVGLQAKVVAQDGVL